MFHVCFDKWLVHNQSDTEYLLYAKRIWERDPFHFQVKPNHIHSADVYPHFSTSLPSSRSHSLSQLMWCFFFLLLFYFNTLTQLFVYRYDIIVFAHHPHSCAFRFIFFVFLHLNFYLIAYPISSTGILTFCEWLHISACLEYTEITSFTRPSAWPQAQHFQHVEHFQTIIICISLNLCAMRKKTQQFQQLFLLLLLFYCSRSCHVMPVMCGLHQIKCNQCWIVIQCKLNAGGNWIVNCCLDA